MEWGWEPGPEQHDDSEDSVCCLACRLACPRTPASSASAPGVPGGSASAEAVAALPGAVDEAQGVLELLVGGFVNGLVREVHLRGGVQRPREGHGLPLHQVEPVRDLCPRRTILLPFKEGLQLTTG